jgi:prepilin-type N-terminal cleavage/methylation domain-containing protein
MKKENGFTFMELAIVMAIIGILSSIAVPAYNSWLPRYRLKHAAMDLRANMSSVKLEAIKNNSDWAIVFDTGNNAYHVCSDDGVNNIWDGPSGDDTVEITMNLSEYGSGIQYTGVSGGPLIFSNRGLSNAVVVNMTNGEGTASYRIQTSLSGGIILDRL